MSTKVTFIILFVGLCAKAVDASEYPVLGGYEVMNVNDREAQAVGRLAAAHLERAKDSFRAYRLHQLISVEKQVVRGLNYRLELIIARTNCYRGEKVNLKNCRAVKVQTCNATIHLPLGLQPSELLSGSCGRETIVIQRTTTRRTTARRTTTEIPPGAPREANVTDEDVIRAASFATQQLTSQSNGQHRVEVLRILRATEQVVSGYLYRLIVEVSLVGSGMDEIKTTQCEVIVLDRSWMSPPYILREYNCDEFID